MKRFLRSNSDFNFFMEKQLINSNTLNLNKLHDRFEIDNPVDKKRTTDFSLGKSFKFQSNFFVNKLLSVGIHHFLAKFHLMMRRGNLLRILLPALLLERSVL